MTAGGQIEGMVRARSLFRRRKRRDEVDADTALRNFIADLGIFVGEALLSAIGLRIAAADGSVPFLMLGILAAIAAALPLRDWIFG